MHRAVVEATHFKNVPLAHLEASQYKNNLVSTALTRGRKAITQEKGEIWQCERPVSNSHRRSSGPILHFRDANNMRCRFFPRMQDLMPFDCPDNVRRRANGWAEFAKMNVQTLYVFLCTWYDAHLQCMQPMKQRHQNSGDAEKWEPSGFPKFIG